MGEIVFKLATPDSLIATSCSPPHLATGGVVGVAARELEPLLSRLFDILGEGGGLEVSETMETLPTLSNAVGSGELRILR
jgi:hypothetical protein